MLVVDDQAPFRFAVKAVLRRLDGFELAGEAASGARGYLHKEHFGAETLRRLWHDRDSGAGFRAPAEPTR